jgi:osomolarity two-component system response regulator SKN7
VGIDKGMDFGGKSGNSWPQQRQQNQRQQQQPMILPKVPAGASSEGMNRLPPVNTSTDFVNKLFSMLEEPLSRNIVHWTAGGDSFVVVDPSEFTKTVLPRHFKHSNFASFVRQLNKYDFHKVRVNPTETSPYGENAWEFKHPDFQLHNREQLENIKRKTPATRKKENTNGGSAGRPSGTDAEVIEHMQRDIESLKRSHQELENQLSRAIDSIDSLQRSASTREHYIKQLMDLLNQQQQNNNNDPPPRQRTSLSPLIPPPPPPAPQEGSYMVLLGEDDEDSVRLCRKFLNQYGCDVDVANDGLEAVQRTQACGYDLILIDSVLPSLDGASATELIRKNTNTRVPVIIMVSTEVNDDAYYKRGITGILRKPFKKDDLFHILDAYLKPSQNEEDNRIKKQRVF